LINGQAMSGYGTKLPFAALKTTSAFWGTAVEKRSFGSIRWTYELALDFGRPEREVTTDRAIKAW
jgi:hypothetical protein